MGAPVGIPVLVFEVGDLVAALKELAAQGHRVGEIRDMSPHGRTASPTDPGNAYLVLFQRAR
ncbi:MAG TPA: hypothetical protein VMW17_00620 [Candidatus Binatia bacterium]|nr:hypothetical protein [Candidatus Binatia bacterium]